MPPASLSDGDSNKCRVSGQGESYASDYCRTFRQNGSNTRVLFRDGLDVKRIALQGVQRGFMGYSLGFVFPFVYRYTTSPSANLQPQAVRGDGRTIQISPRVAALKGSEGAGAAFPFLCSCALTESRFRQEIGEAVAFSSGWREQLSQVSYGVECHESRQSSC